MNKLGVWIVVLLSISGIAIPPATARDQLASADAEAGEVRVPLQTYTDLLEAARQEPRRAPVPYAVGTSHVDVAVSALNGRVTAKVVTRVELQTFEDEWTLVPILPPGAALTEARVNGRLVQLVQGPDGLSWSTNRAGTVEMQLVYGLDAQRSETGLVLPVPVPRASATRLHLEIPGRRLDLAVIPSADLAIEEDAAADLTRVGASVPATASVLVTWRALSTRPFVLSRASYAGELDGEAVIWTALYEIEVFSGELITLPLLPLSTTLGAVLVDGEAAIVLTEEDRFTTLLRGIGRHEVQVRFQTAVLEDNGPPQTTVLIPRVPISRFHLMLPGRKELTVSPQANVSTREAEDHTESTVFVPMGDQVVFSWVDAVPADLRAQVRANASVYHAVHADEGVLHVQGVVAYEISHGETNTLALTLPADVQVNRIAAPQGGVPDWAVEPIDGNRKKVSVFLDRPVKGDFNLEVLYEHLLRTERGAEADSGSGKHSAVPVPLIRVLDVHRQRGMVALLAGQDLTLEPVDEERLSRVGENQLPAFLRNRLDMTVAHTYKYIDEAAGLRVRTVAPERKQGVFDAQVDTLVSIGEVSLRGSATVQIDVKSGAIMALTLSLPPNVNVLGITGPSLRTHQVIQDPQGPRVELAFTQEMEGQFRLEVSYERIMLDTEAEVLVPIASVADAQVEHGRIAVEALTAVEIRSGETEQLSNVDVNELPRQLVLKTTNPILLAYKYVRTQTPFRLTLDITRHKEIDVQTAAIEWAAYRTLYTADGLAVTSAHFQVRNSRRQFLRLELPADGEVWAAFVDGRAEKPAQVAGEQADRGRAVLLKMVNSANGFPVEVVYASRLEKMGKKGRIMDRLPRPDMVVTRTQWDVFLPTRYQYQQPESSMRLIVDGQQVSPREAIAALDAAEPAARAVPTQALRIDVPAEGVHYAFEKLYANQADEAAAFGIEYSVPQKARPGLWSSLVGILLLAAGVGALALRCVRRSRAAASAALGAVAGGGLLLTGVFGPRITGLTPTTALAGVAAVAVILLLAARALAAGRRGPAPRATPDRPSDSGR